MSWAVPSRERFHDLLSAMNFCGSVRLSLLVLGFNAPLMQGLYCNLPSSTYPTSAIQRQFFVKALHWQKDNQEITK